MQITSATNPQFKIWKSLTTSKGIKENNRFFLMGEKLVAEFFDDLAGFAARGFKPEYLIFDDEISPPSTGKASTGKASTGETRGEHFAIRTTQLSPELFKELDVLGTKSPLLILTFNDFAVKDFSLPPKGLELICPLGDPRNLGALIRSAAGFSVNEIILTKESTHPFLPHSIKASAGAALKISFSKTALATSEIPLIGANFALALFGESINSTSWPPNLRLWVGEEGPGLRLEHTQKKTMKFVNVPTKNIESLNAMVSTSLALWEWKKQN